MGVFTFVCRSSGDEWCAKQLSGELEASASSTFDLQRKLVQLARAVDSYGGIQSSYSPITPSSSVFQVIVGGGSATAFVGGGAAAAAAPAGGAPPAEAPPAEAKKEEKEESEDEDMGFSLFD